MKKVFSNSSRLQCIFTDDSVSFCGEKQEVCFPYGCLDSINLSLLGVLQATCHTQICSFAVDRKDRSEVKDLVRFVKKEMASAPAAEPIVVDYSPAAKQQIPEDLPNEEKLRRYKELFIQGLVSKEEYDARKRQLKN